MTSELYEIFTAERECAAKSSAHKDNSAYSDDYQRSWYKRFGHRDPEAIKNLVGEGLATGLELTDCGKRENCESCVKGKIIQK